MLRPLSLVLIATIAFSLAQTARADGFTATVEVSTGDHKASATNDAAVRKDKPLSARPRLQASADSKFTIHWKITRTAPEPVKDALVHFYLVQIERPGQAPPPLEPGIVQLESALTMDFDAKTAASAQMSFRAQKAGVYLVRIDVEGANAGTFAEMDLVVK